MTYAVFKKRLLCASETDMQLVDLDPTGSWADDVCDERQELARFHQIIDGADGVGTQSTVGMHRVYASQPDLLCAENYVFFRDTSDVEEPMGVSARELVAVVGGLSNPEAAVAALSKASKGDLDGLR